LVADDCAACSPWRGQLVGGGATAGRVAVPVHCVWDAWSEGLGGSVVGRAWER